ncbi:MAG: hypothetical protein LBL82_02375 [Oscillospiraceae bacterium]|jgi:hypothetical protein|nr:hypothetical protein [Oscillospiraceae bacterium]
MSVIFSAALFGLGYIASATAHIGDFLFTPHVSFEISQDGEALWQGSEIYDFVGFSDGLDFSVAIDDSLCPSLGRFLGNLSNEDWGRVFKINTNKDSYIMLFQESGDEEIYKLRG